MYGPSPSYLAACCKTAFLIGFGLGTESSACLGGVLFACGGLLPPPLLENLEEKLENQEFLRWGDALVPVGEPFLSLGLEPYFGKLDRAGMGLGAAGLAAVVGETGAISWLLVVERLGEDAVGTGGSRGCCEYDLGLVTVFVALSTSAQVLLEIYVDWEK